MNNNSNLRFWANYLLRRVLRIYPLYFILLVIYFLIRQQGYKYCICIGSKESILDHLLLQKGNGPFWSIPVEFKYYILSPFIILSYKYIFKWNNSAILWFTALIIIYTTYLGIRWEGEQINRNTIYYLPVFLVGSYLSYIDIKFKKEIFDIGINYKIFVDVVGLSSFVFLVIISGSFFYKELFSHEVFMFFRQYYFAPAIFIGITIFSSLYGKGVVKYFFSFKPLRYIGVISFSLYLIHYPVLKYFKELEFSFYDSQIKLILYFIVAILFSTISYLTVERRFSKINLITRKN